MILFQNLLTTMSAQSKHYYPDNSQGLSFKSLQKQRQVL